MECSFGNRPHLLPRAIVMTVFIAAIAHCANSNESQPSSSDLPSSKISADDNGLPTVGEYTVTIVDDVTSYDPKRDLEWPPYYPPSEGCWQNWYRTRIDTAWLK